MAATSVSVTVLHSLLQCHFTGCWPINYCLHILSELLISLATIHLPFVIKYGKCTGSLYMLSCHKLTACKIPYNSKNISKHTVLDVVTLTLGSLLTHIRHASRLQSV